MAGPIYRLTLTRRKPAWFELSKEERDAFLKRQVEIGKTIDHKEIGGPYNIRWSSGEWDFFNVWEFPNVEEQQKMAKASDEWFKYFEQKSFLGTKFEEGDFSS